MVLDRVNGITNAKVFVIVTKTTEGKEINANIAAKLMMANVTDDCQQVGIR